MPLAHGAESGRSFPHDFTVPMTGQFGPASGKGFRLSVVPISTWKRGRRNRDGIPASAVLMFDGLGSLAVDPRLLRQRFERLIEVADHIGTQLGLTCLSLLKAIDSLGRTLWIGTEELAKMKVEHRMVGSLAKTE